MHHGIALAQRSSGTSKLSCNPCTPPARDDPALIGEFEYARDAFERGLTPIQLPASDLYWEGYRILHYIVTLQRTGLKEQADFLTNAVMARINRQRAAGILHFGAWSFTRENLNMHAAALYALRGDHSEALEALRSEALFTDFSCSICLDLWPHFDSLRGDPEFEAVRIKEKERITSWRRRLEAKGLLLTPDQVLAQQPFTIMPMTAR